MQEYVAWIEISMHDTQLVDLLDGQKHLGDERLGLILLKVGLLYSC